MQILVGGSLVKGDGQGSLTVGAFRGFELIAGSKGAGISQQRLKNCWRALRSNVLI